MCGIEVRFFRKTDWQWGIQCQHGGEHHAFRTMADTQRPAVFPAAANRQLSQAPHRPGGAALPDSGIPGGPGSAEYPHRAQPAPGGPYYEEGVMRGQTFSGP